jgi:RNA polymerase sigma-70 factor (ECF subfamily)
MQPAELERIYDEHAPSAAALFRRFAGCEADIRDLLQDWLVKIATGVTSLEPIENERSYLLRIAYRLAVDWTRRKGTRRKTEDRVAQDRVAQEHGFRQFCPEDDPDRELLRKSLEEALADLPIDQQLVVQMKLWDGMTFPEMAGVLGISSNTVSSRYRYGIAKIRESLQPLYEDLCIESQ